MKFLEAQKQAGKKEVKSVIPEGENKMQKGNRLDQKDPQSLISGIKGKTDGAEHKGPTTNETGALEALARELKVDLATVKGTGPNGSITEKDVRAAKK